MATGHSDASEAFKLLRNRDDRFLSSEDLERHAVLYAEIQQCRVEMVYCSLLVRRRLQRRIMRAEAEICRLLPPAKANVHCSS